MARWQNNALLLPGFVQTARALAEGLSSGELLHKLRISLAYLEKATVWSDIGLLFMTAMVCARPSLSALYGAPPSPPAPRVPQTPVWTYVAPARSAG